MRAFYRGISANILRVIPASAVTFTSFDLIHRWLTVR